MLIAGAESVAAEDRGGYYGAAGALRDTQRNRVLDVQGLVAPKPPPGSLNCAAGSQPRAASDTMLAAESHHRGPV